jgi:hypothetical protein
MKRIAIIIPTLAAAMMISAMPAFSDEEYGSTMGGGEKANAQKDECILVAKNCGDSVDTIQQRIDKLQREINKGSDVYTTDELRILNQKLEDTNRFLNNMEEGGA